MCFVVFGTDKPGVEQRQRLCAVRWDAVIKELNALCKNRCNRLSRRQLWKKYCDEAMVRGEAATATDLMR